MVNAVNFSLYGADVIPFELNYDTNNRLYLILKSIDLLKTAFITI